MFVVGSLWVICWGLDGLLFCVYCLGLRLLILWVVLSALPFGWWCVLLVLGYYRFNVALEVLVCDVLISCMVRFYGKPSSGLLFVKMVFEVVLSFWGLGCG